MNFLEKIKIAKEAEVSRLFNFIDKYQNDTIAKIYRGDVGYSGDKSFKKQLSKPGLSVIAEIKRRSPSKGHLANIENPIQLANSYVENGASAISILTDENAFGGSLNDLKSVRHVIQTSPCPILRKDFIIDKIQIAESIAAGADAVLLIAALLGQSTKTLLDFCRHANIPALVEVHDSQELELAIRIGADIIGINNRNLKTLDVDINTSHSLIKQIPEHITTVAESGIDSPSTANELHQAGFDAVLVGEALVKHPAIETFFQALVSS